MLSKIYTIFIQIALKDKLSKYLYVLSIFVLINAYFEYNKYIFNPILELENLHSSHGVIQAVYLGKSRHLIFNNETYYISPIKLDKTFLKNKNAKIWYQERKGILGTQNIIHQIKIGNWVLRDDYTKYYNNQIKHQKFSSIILGLHLIAIISIFIFIYNRHKSKIYNKHSR